MKKYMLAVIAVVFSMGAMAQTHDHAIGARFGGGNAFGAEFTYQMGLSNVNRLELDLGLTAHSNYSGFSLAGAYHWLFNIEGGFNWYVGPAASIGSWSYKSSYDTTKDDGFYLGLGAQGGVEYNFDEIPLQLSVDSRPQIPIGAAYNDFYFGVAFSARYTFGK